METTEPMLETQQGLQRKTDWRGAFVIGLAGTILVTGIGPAAVQAMGAASIPVFAFCVVAAVVLYDVSRRARGLDARSFRRHALLRRRNVARHAGGVSAWGYWLAWFPVAPINMLIAANYIVVLLDLPTGAEFTPITSPVTVAVIAISIVGMIVLFIPCLLGIQLGARFATVLGFLSVLPLTALCLPAVLPARGHSLGIRGRVFATRSATGTFTFFICWIFIMAWSVLAIEAAACYIGECRNPARDAKIALSLASGYGAFIYLALPLMLVAVLGPAMTQEGSADILVAFLTYTQAIFGPEAWVQWMISIPLIIALVFTVLHAIMGCGRSLYQVAEDGTLPRFFQHTNRYGVPDFAMTFNLACSIVVVFFGSPLEIYIFSVVGYLLCVGLALVGYFIHRQMHPELARPVRMPGFLRFAALAFGMFFLFVWLYGGYYAGRYRRAERPTQALALLPRLGHSGVVPAALRLQASGGHPTGEPTRRRVAARPRATDAPSSPRSVARG